MSILLASRHRYNAAIGSIEPSAAGRFATQIGQAPGSELCDRPAKLSIVNTDGLRWQLDASRDKQPAGPETFPHTIQVSRKGIRCRVGGVPSRKVAVLELYVAMVCPE